ncbi:MAG: SufB/SufD family protein [Alphaproteobacteria bacterium]
MKISNNLFLIQKQNSVLVDHPSETEWRFVVQKEGELEAFFLCLNHDLKVSVLLKGEKAKSDIKCCYLSNKNNMLNIDIKVLHEHEKTSSNQKIKGLATDESMVSLSAAIEIPKKTNECEGYQNHRGILLSDKAKISAIPQLEIWSEDVICSHGSAVGPLPKEELFYLETRGLAKATAEKLLLSSFFNDIVPDEFNSYIEEWMEQNV